MPKSTLDTLAGGSLVSLFEGWDFVKKWVKLYIPVHLGRGITVATVRLLTLT